MVDTQFNFSTIVLFINFYKNSFYYSEDIFLKVFINRFVLRFVRFDKGLIMIINCKFIAKDIKTKISMLLRCQTEIFSSSSRFEENISIFRNVHSISYI